MCSLWISNVRRNGIRRDKRPLSQLSWIDLLTGQGEPFAIRRAGGPAEG